MICNALQNVSANVQLNAESVVDLEPTGPFQEGIASWHGFF